MGAGLSRNAASMDHSHGVVETMARLFVPSIDGAASLRDTPMRSGDPLMFLGDRKDIIPALMFQFPSAIGNSTDGTEVRN